jgi:hypothetical protein
MRQTPVYDALEQSVRVVAAMFRGPGASFKEPNRGQQNKLETAFYNPSE